ncbi:MAG: tetratricopeptide repeat protein [Agathobacter sp.]|nr:tetratricopeptide repeat protein [Agathobacter sp.]
MRIKRYRTVAVVLMTTLTMTLGACGQKENKEQDAYRQYGITCMESGNYEEALKAFQNALDQSQGKVGEKELDICFYKAKAQMLSGDTEGAFETYNAIIKYNKDARAYYLRGNLYFDMGEPEKALVDYDQAVKRNPEDYELYMGIYESMSRHDMETDGQKYLNMAMERKGDKPQDQLYKGRICYLLGDTDSAITYLTKAKEASQPLASYYLALTYEQQGEKKQAEACIEEYLDSGVATAYDLYDLGHAEMEEEDYKEALKYFNAALKMEEVPNRQNLMKGAIAAYEYSGDFAAAKKMMKDYLAQYPSDEDAQRESIFLETRS